MLGYGNMNTILPTVILQTGLAIYRQFSLLCCIYCIYLSMNDFMTTKGAGLAKSFTTHFADEWSRACVHRHMAR